MSRGRGRNGGAIGAVRTTTDSLVQTGIWGLFDAHQLRSADTWANEGDFITFRYHMFGSGMESFYVFWEVGSGRSLKWSKTGQQHTSETDEWDLATIDMSSNIGQTGQIQIVVIVGANGNGLSDGAFCDFQLRGQTIFPTIASNWRTHTLADRSNGNSTNAAASLSTTVIPSTSTSRTWSVRSGPTATSSTGPDQHYDNNSSSDYIYYESSGGSTSTDTGFCIRANSTITI